MIYLKDYSKLEECISEEINKESSLLQSIYKETGDSEERVGRFAKLIGNRFAKFRFQWAALRIYAK